MYLSSLWKTPNVLSVEKMQLKDAPGARTSGIAQENVNLSSGKDISLYAISYLAIDKRMTKSIKKSKQFRKKKCLSLRH